MFLHKHTSTSQFHNNTEDIFIISEHTNNELSLTRSKCICSQRTKVWFCGLSQNVKLGIE